MPDETIMGPVQMLVVGFQDNERFTGEILAELQRLKEADLVRLIDLLFVAKQDGELAIVQLSDLTQEQAEEFGATVGALIGLGAAGAEGAEEGAMLGAAAMEDGHVFDEDDVIGVAEAIPEGTSAGIALLEHRWAIPLRDAIARAGGMALLDEWIHASNLIEIGLDVADAAVAADQPG
jgi:uncharacterized membrane protein